ncbi:hypothetical protein V1506DRAFT_542329 [Lipomyces tetrasporus]
MSRTVLRRRNFQLLVGTLRWKTKYSCIILRCRLCDRSIPFALKGHRKHTISTSLLSMVRRTPVCRCVILWLFHVHRDRLLAWPWGVYSNVHIHSLFGPVGWLWSFVGSLVCGFVGSLVFVGFRGWCIFMYISNGRALSKKKRPMVSWLQSRSLLPFSRLNLSIKGVGAIEKSRMRSTL